MNQLFTPKTVQRIAVAILILIGSIIVVNQLKIDIKATNVEFHLSRE